MKKLNPYKPVTPRSDEQSFPSDKCVITVLAVLLTFAFICIVVQEIKRRSTESLLQDYVTEQSDEIYRLEQERMLDGR